MKRKFKITFVLLLIIIVLSTIIFISKKDKNILENKEKEKTNFLTYMVETVAGSNKYEARTDIKFPLNEYHINIEKSGCENGGELIWDDEKGKVESSLSSSDRCYLYFDNINVQTNFSYTGDYVAYTVPTTGTYKIELWGASGGQTKSKSDGKTESCLADSYGRGAYTKGEIKLKRDEIIYIYVGETREKYDPENLVFNGGGPGESVGGGSTDVRLKSGNWDNFDSLKSRIMVAAGGGGCAYNYSIIESDLNQRGDGGAINGFDARWNVNDSFDYSGHGATQTTGGKPGNAFDPKNCYASVETPNMTGHFGKGGYGVTKCGGYTYASSGGGGGYYGGGYGIHPGGTWTGGGGGSSFISGYKGCVAIKAISTEDDVQPKDNCEDGTTDKECSYHYSGKIFTETQMIAGNAEMPKPDGGTEVGHTGNGYARITLVK